MEIWIFHGTNGRFASGAFSTRKLAEEWILQHELSGVLTLYPLDIGVYDWALTNDFFEIKKMEQKEALFIQKFTSASQEHYHYDNGQLD